MALMIFRGLTRSQYGIHRAICSPKFYSAKPAPNENSIEARPKLNDARESHAQPVSDAPESSVMKQKLDDLRTKNNESQHKSETMKENIRGYVFTRFMDYVKNYERAVEKKYPGAFKVYRVYMDGVANFYRDMKDYVKIGAKLLGTPENINQLTRRELEIYYQLPRDMRKVGPLLLVSSIPFAQYATMPVAYMYPRKLLTYHFWTLQQRSEFAIINLQDRISHNLKVFRFLQSKLSQVKNDVNYEKWRHVLGQLGSGTHPTAEEVISVKELFAAAPYKTSSLSYMHIKSLCRLHDINWFWFRKSRLAHRAQMMHLMDIAIDREGGPASLSTEALRNCCFMRGLNASNLSNDELVRWLDQWVQVSKNIDTQNFSLYLHLPVLIAYNHPNNWKLLYKERPLQ